MFDDLRRRIDTMAQPPAFFFRDDDADRDLPELRQLLGLFECRGVPVSLAVVPGTLTPAGARLLRQASPSTWLRVHQHGWMHDNHEPNGKKCEFGPSRCYVEQRADIARGWNKLATMLDERCDPVFTPPWNRCTADTLRVLDELNYRGVSMHRGAGPRACPFREVSTAVDIFQWKPERQLKSAAEISAEIGFWLDSPEPVGILLHHKVMSGDAFALAGSLLDALAPRARFFHLEALACEA